MKHVKKSMFISTVLMVVMLIAALSTATFAWYTSNNTAASKSTTVGAAQSNDANIGIGFYIGAQENEIQFFALADGTNGNLNPVAPTTYFHEYSATNAIKQSLSDCYATSIKNTETSFISNGVNGYDYRRVVQMNDTQILNIVAQEAFTHDHTAVEVDSNNNTIYTKLTNLKEGDHFNGNYEHIYKVKMYAYNNGVAIDGDGKPSVGNAITVSASYNYTVITPAIADTCYRVEAVYEIVSAAGENIANSIAEVNTGNFTKITQYCANQLLQQFNANYTPIAGTYLVMYYDYHVLPYTTTDVTTADARAEEVGYAGDIERRLNDAQHDIKAESVINQPATYPTYKSSVTTGNPVGITSISYDARGFAYLYKTFSAPSDYATTTNANNFAGFTFSKASVNQMGYFKDSGGSAEIGGLWGGNKTQYNYNAAGIDIGLVQGKAATSSEEPTSTFYVTNNGTTNISRLEISLGATGDNANLLRVAVFRDGKYYGTLASVNNAPTTFGTILEGGLASNMPKYNAYQKINLGGLEFGPDHAAAFQLVAWFDGSGLNDQAAGKNCSFTLSFEAFV